MKITDEEGDFSISFEAAVNDWLNNNSSIVMVTEDNFVGVLSILTNSVCNYQFTSLSGLEKGKFHISVNESLPVYEKIQIIADGITNELKSFNPEFFSFHFFVTEKEAAEFIAKIT